MCTVTEKITKLLYEPNHNFSFGTSAVVLISLLSTVSRYLVVLRLKFLYVYIKLPFGKTVQEREEHDLCRDLGMGLDNNSWAF